MSQKLIILMGVPGSGKTTWAQTMLNLRDRDLDYVSSDDIRREYLGGLTQDFNDVVFGMLHWRVIRCLGVGRSVVVDTTALDKRSRMKLIELANFVNPRIPVHLIVFADWKTALDRNAKRVGPERVPDDVMERMVDKYRLSELQVPIEPYDSVTTVADYSVPGIDSAQEEQRSVCAV